MTENLDSTETVKFGRFAEQWWDPDGPLHTLHDINPVRLEYITRRVDLKGQLVLDLGCGGGLLSESMAEAGARVTGIDASHEAISIARQHNPYADSRLQYEISTVEAHIKHSKAEYDVITCMELLEHVPDPASIIRSSASLLRPGGHLFFSTINRTLKAYLTGVIAAEYILGLLPKGTHEYARFIKPSELASVCTQNNLLVRDITGMAYMPYLRRAWLHPSPSINYLLHATKQ